MDIIGKKNLFFFISGLVIVPGIISLLLFGVRLSIDFTGGTLLELKIVKSEVQDQKLKITEIVKEQNIDLASVQEAGNNIYLLRMEPIDKDQNIKLQEEISKNVGKAEEIRFESIGPTIGRETAVNALKAVVLASIVIIIYIAWAFRHIPKPYSSVKFGISAVAALMHDVLLLVGIFSLLGHFLNVEIDGLFITALLTVMGFSVHDSIVVFDRIRENLRKNRSFSFSHVVNESIIQTLARSLSTSLTVVFTLTALLFFGGESIRWFVIALLVGVISGTYSSVFNAAPLLVLWEEWSERKKK